MRRLSAKWVEVFKAFDHARYQARLMEEQEAQRSTNGLLLLLGISALGFVCFLLFRTK